MPGGFARRLAVIYRAEGIGEVRTGVFALRAIDEVPVVDIRRDVLDDTLLGLDQPPGHDDRGGTGALARAG